MNLREKLNSIRDSELYKLSFNGEVVGIRAKLFNSSTERFMYADSLKDFLSKELVSFIGSKWGSLRTLNLVMHNGKLVTKSEIDNQVEVTELKDTSFLDCFIDIYAYKEEVTADV